MGEVMTKIFDGHGDIWNDVVKKRMSGEAAVIKNHHLDKFKKGNIFSGIFVIWIDSPPEHQPEKRFKQIFDAMHSELVENSDLLHVVKKVEDFDDAQLSGKFPIVLGIEGLDGIHSIEALESLYDYGFRHASLTWNMANDFATGVKGSPNEGLTELGYQAIKFMEAKGMLIDVSHLNEKSFWDIISVVNHPIIASHSNVKELCPVPRNLTDEQIIAIKNTGGLIGVNAFREFIDLEQSKQTVSRLADHIDYLVILAGIDHVGFGFDFVDYLDEEAMGTFSNGLPEYTKGLENCTMTENLIKELKARGYTETDIDKISYKNFMRVFKSL